MNKCHYLFCIVMGSSVKYNIKVYYFLRVPFVSDVCITFKYIYIYVKYTSVLICVTLLQTIGSWHLNTLYLQIDASAIRWYPADMHTSGYDDNDDDDDVITDMRNSSSHMVPISICSRPCLRRQYKIQLDLKCCWDCRLHLASVRDVCMHRRSALYIIGISQ